MLARLNRTSEYLDLQALVTLTNATDTAFEGAALRLVAGEVNQGRPASKRPQSYMRAEVAASMAPAADMSPPVAAAYRYAYPFGRPAPLTRGERKPIPRIGSAKRRERMCQNVEISRGGVYIKQKKN